MFFLRRYCCKRLTKHSLNGFGSRQRETVSCEGKDTDKNDQSSTKKTDSCRKKCDDDCSENHGDIKIGIIGGGMAPIYASLLLKQSPLIKQINIADPKDTLAGAVCDLNDIDTSTRIKYYGKKLINEALIDVDIIALMDETDFDIGKEGPVTQFIVTSGYVHEMAKSMVQSCSSALVAVFARPVTATLPMVTEVYKRAKLWDPNRIVGSTAIDAMRISAMTATLFDLNAAYLSVPIVGGADPTTVVPLLTRARPVHQFSLEHENMLIRQLRAADEELASFADGYAGPSLSTGAAAAKFIDALASGLTGHSNVIRSAYVRSDVLPVCRFFATELKFGPRGVETNFGLPKVSPRAVELIEQAVPRINELCEMAVDIVRQEDTPSIKS